MKYIIEVGPNKGLHWNTLTYIINNVQGLIYGWMCSTISIITYLRVLNKDRSCRSKTMKFLSLLVDVFLSQSNVQKTDISSSDLGIWYTKTTYASVRLDVMASHSDVFLPPSNKRQCISVCHCFKLYPYDHINNYFSAQSRTRIVWSGTVDTQKQPTAHLFEQSSCWFVVFPPPCNKRQYVSVWTHTQLRNGTISSGSAWSSMNTYLCHIL